MHLAVCPLLASASAPFAFATSNMDPTAAELAAITNLNEALAWAGVELELEASLRSALGQPARVREVALIPRSGWDTAVIALQVPSGAAPGPGEPRPTRNLTLVEGARVESFRRVCLLLMGRSPADDIPGTGSVAPVPVPPPGPPTGGSRKLKLASILDPTLDAEVLPIPQSELQVMYTDYKAKFGDFPGPDVDPSPDQLAALKQVLAAGSPPYADFSIFGPYGLRLLRKQSFTSYTLNVATGEWSKREQPGPSTFHAWYQAFKVLRAALLLLDAVDAERLDAYSELVRGFVQQFGDDAWWIIYRAESRMRSEHLERIRRLLAGDPAFGFTAARPWNASFAGAIKEQDFWTRELVTPATLWLAQHKSSAAKAPGGSGSTGGPGIPPPEPAEAKRRARAKRKFQGEDLSRKEGDVYVLNRKGVEICKNYNQGKCGTAAAQGRCEHKRSHQCNICLGPHQAISCPKAKAN